MLKKSILVAFIATLFPVLLFSEMNPALKINPVLEKKLSELKGVKLKKYLEQIESFSFSKDRGAWKYNLKIKNPKQSNILAKIYGQTLSNKEILLGSSVFVGTSLSKTFDNKMYKALKVVIYKKENKIQNIKLDQAYVTLPRIKAQILELTATPAPNKAWSFKIKNTTSVPMKFDISLTEEISPGTNHGNANYQTETIAPNGIHVKNGIVGYLKVGNKLTLGVRDSSTNGILDRKVIIVE